MKRCLIIWKAFAGACLGVYSSGCLRQPNAPVVGAKDEPLLSESTTTQSQMPPLQRSERVLTPIATIQVTDKDTCDIVTKVLADHDIVAVWEGSILHGLSVESIRAKAARRAIKADARLKGRAITFTKP